MSSHYPVPPHAASVWTVGDKLFLDFPDLAGRRNTVIIPLDKMIPEVGMVGLPKAHHRGFAILLETLRQREKAERFDIGLNGSPTKHEILTAAESDEKYQKWLDALAANSVVKKQELAEADALLRQVGLL